MFDALVYYSYCVCDYGVRCGDTEKPRLGDRSYGALEIGAAAVQRLRLQLLVWL